MDFSEIDVPKALEENGVKYTLSRLRIQGCEVPASTTVTDEDLKGWPDVCLWMDEAYLVKDARKRYACGAWCKKNYGLGGYEGVLCYLYGGADLCLRVLKGVLASPMRKPGVEEAVIIRTKAATNLKAIAFLQTELAAVTGSFVYISVQPLGGGWRTLLMLSCNEAGDFIIEKNALIVCKRHDVIKKLEDLLVHNSTDAFQALFKAGPPSELKNLTICVQLQAFNAEAMTRRWWKLLEADGHGGEAFRAVMQRVATPVYRIAAEKQTFKDENVVEKMYATEAFTLNSYKRMRDDNDRTGGYKKAIEMTCKGKIVMEIGTGPFALLALFAAAAGASHVYAIEADPEAAKSAQQYINNSGYTNVTLIVGLSTAVSLPSGVRAEVVVHELIGVLTTEECVIETLNDAAERLLVLDYVSIPHKVSTMASLYPVVLGDEAPPESKCSCCKGGWNLGIGLENRSCSEVREVEAVYFDRKRLPHTSASKQTVLFESVSAVRGVGCWVVLQLLATDEIMVSSLKDSSCWPKLFVKFASPVAVRGELTFEAVVSHPMEYRFEYGGQTVIVKNRSPTELDRWLSGEREGVLVDSEDGEVRVTHVNNVSVGNLAKAAELQAGGVPIVRIQHCRHSNTLSPLHKAVLNDDTQQITALCGTDEAWAVRDGVWGLTASHFEVIMGKPPRKGVTATDTHLKGTPEEWYKLFRYSEEAADVKVVNGAREGVMGLKEFTAVTGKKYLTRNLMTRDHVLECLMRCKAEGTVGREKLHVSDENLVLSMTGVQAAKPFTKGEYICRLHGVVISTATKTDHPPTQMHPFPHPIPYALYTGEYTSLAGLLPHSDHPNCTRSMTTYKGMMCMILLAEKDIGKNEGLTLYYE